MAAVAQSAPGRRRFRPPRRLRITREGWFYFGFIAVVGLGAINSGNNLLYLILGLQLTTIVVSGVLSEQALRGLSVRSVETRDARAGEEACWYLEVAKGPGWLPSLGLTLTAEDGPALRARAGLLQLAPGARAEVALRFTPPRRGHFRSARVSVSTRFPFGLLEKARDFDVAEEFWVYPARAPRGPLPQEPSRREGERPTGRAGHGPELLALRPLASGDALSQLHWKKSAAGQGWVVAVREREQERELHLEVDLAVPAEPEALGRLEAALSRACSSAESALERGMRVSLALGRERIAAGSGGPHRRRLLRALAQAEPELGAG